MTGEVGNWIQRALDWITNGDIETLPFSIRDELAIACDPDVASFVSVLAACSVDMQRQPDRAKILMQLVAARLNALTVEIDGTPTAATFDATTVDVEDLKVIYERLISTAPEAAAHTLQCLAMMSDSEAIEALADIIIESPPEDWRHVGLALSPLWQTRRPEVLQEFFDRTSHSNIHPVTLAVLLDLANHSVRREKLNEHPWTPRSAALSDLLARVTVRLRQLEKEPQKFGDSIEQVQTVLGESLTLTVSLCDALGLIGDVAAAGSLTQAMDLSHRRIQSEAACALARMGDEAGRKRLIELAADRVARLRAVQYAEELGFADEIDSELRCPRSLAESELAAWLASPDQFAFPPSEMELLDMRTQYWPSYEEPRDCYLFRYTYKLPSAEQISNVGIAGPCVHAFRSDLANLPVDDIYAAFAGWQAEHEEIFEVPMDQLNSAQRRVADELLAHLRDTGLEIQQPIALTFFFGEIALLALVEQEVRRLCAVTDAQEALCLPISDRPASLTPDVVLNIFRGRKLLRTFNT